MKKIFVAFFLIPVQVCLGQDCNTQAASKPSQFERWQDNYSDRNGISYKKAASWDISKMKLNLVKAESWIRSRLTGFTGAKLCYSNNYNLDFIPAETDKVSPSFIEHFYNATGIRGACMSNMRFYAYYCYDNKIPIQTEEECGSFVQVNINNVFASTLCTEIGVFTINGKYTFKIFEKSRSEGMIDIYDLRAKYVNDSIYTSYRDVFIIRNSDKPLYIPITRKEYLEQMLKDIEVYKMKSKSFRVSNYENSQKAFEKEMSVYKSSDKSYTAEKEAKRRKWFNEDNNPEKLAKDLKKLEDEVIGAKLVINEYLGKSQEWLGRGFRDFYNGSFENYYPAGLRKYFEELDVYTESREDNTRTEIASINPAYFNKSLGKDMPQLIAVTVLKGRYPHMLKVARLVKQPGALAALEELLK
jgi:hypothetical protein